MRSKLSAAVLEEMLPTDCFFRTHRNYLVNLKYVRKFTRDTVYLQQGPPSVYLSLRKYTAFQKACLQYERNK